MSSGYDGNYGWEVVHLAEVMNIVDMRFLVQLPTRLPACLRKQVRREKGDRERLRRWLIVWKLFKLPPGELIRDE